MCMKYSVFYLLVATVVAEPPVFIGLRPQSGSTLPLHAGPPIYQQLPHEQRFADFLRPSGYYQAPDGPERHVTKSIDFEIPPEDSYNAAFLHSYGQQHQTGYDQGPTETQVHKHIYVHAPPKDYEQEDDIQLRLLPQRGPKQKHYKIVFIKAPEAPSVRTPIVAPLPQTEEKTLIYVLHKRPETQPNIFIPSPEPAKPSKPEVYFIKYKSKKQEAPVYGPPPALEDLPSRQAGADNNIADDDLMTSDVQQNELEATTMQPHASSATEAPAIQNAATESNAVDEDIPATTVEPISQYLATATTLAPIVVKAMDETGHIPANTYGAPRRSRYFIERRK